MNWVSLKLDKSRFPISLWNNYESLELNSIFSSLKHKLEEMYLTLL